MLIDRVVTKTARQRALKGTGHASSHQEVVSNIILIDPGSKKEHLHIVFGEDGEVLHEKWTENH